MKNNLYITCGFILLVVTGLTAQNEVALTALPHKKPTLKVALFYTPEVLAQYNSKTGVASGFQAQLGDQIRAYQNAIHHSGLDYHVTIVSNTLVSPTTDIAIETLLHYTQPHVIVFIDAATDAAIPPHTASAYRSAVVSVDALIQNPLAMATSLHQAVTHTTPKFVTVPYNNAAQKGTATADKITTSKKPMPVVSFSEKDKTAFIYDISKLNLTSPDTVQLSQSIQHTQTQSVIDVTNTMLITPGKSGVTTLLSFDEGAADDNFLVFSAEGFTAFGRHRSHEAHNADATGNTSPSDDTNTSKTSSSADNDLNSPTAPIPAAQLLTPYPNPTTSIINIPYMVERESLIHLTIYDNTGHLIESLVLDETHPTGIFNYKWDTRDVRSGVYLCFLEANGTVAHHRITKR